MATQADVLRILAEMHSQGIGTLRASSLAERLWPERRNENANGQVFPLGAGIAGRMLRQCKAVQEVSPREWQILPHRLPKPD